jgi:hypothetical protein
MVMLLPYSHILKSWKNYFCKLLYVHGVNKVRQTEMHTAEPFVPESSSFVVEITIQKLRNVNHQVLIKFRQSWSKWEVMFYILSSTKLLILF